MDNMLINQIVSDVCSLSDDNRPSGTGVVTVTINDLEIILKRNLTPVEEPLAYSMDDEVLNMIRHPEQY